MLIKFETKSARVKGLVFHPKRRWVLASLHNGVVQLWDYSERTLIDKFDEHKGPVRGLDFHKHQPLFVSGGDDSKIKVWNYKSRRCLFTLDAHEDYIRTTYFHHEHPWIISTSDDQSIRIWNWQSRSRIAVLTGHTHYVMCAQFHPSTELILSASIDQTLRLWDITGLKMKSTSSSMSQKEEISTGLPEILSKTDYSVESKDAHNSEINWCCFHPDPSKHLCLSAADDNYIKVWKIDSRNSIREVDTLRGHYNNVSCAIFHPRKDLVLSASEDRSIRVWDLDRRSALSTHRKEIDRFWAIAAHPKENLFAAGHDTGFMLFKLERERPAYTVVNDVILFIKEKHLCKYNMKTHEKSVLATLKPKIEMTHHYHKIHCYTYDDNKVSQVLVSVRSTNIEKSVYDLYKISRYVSDESSDSLRRQGLTAIFIDQNRYAVLDKSKRVVFKKHDEETKMKVTITGADEIYSAGPGRLFVKSKINDADTISLWDLEKGSAIYSVKLDVKYVVMSNDRKYIACVGSNKIVICDGQLNILSTIYEQRKIKSAAWEENGVLIYSTPVHVKYALSDGDATTILSVQQTLYIMAVKDNKVICIDRNGDIKLIPVDSREFIFKQAVIRNDRSAILSSLRQLRSLTRAEISFLVKKGHPGLALKFVKDDQTRFPLALQAFDIDEALVSASNLNDKRCWEQLAEVAMQVGHIKAAETAYHYLKKPYKLAMLYLVANLKDKMLEARSLARELGDTSTEFIISLMVKDFTECTQIIRRCGHPNLAYTCAVNHGLHDLAYEISQELTEKQLMHLPPLEQADINSLGVQQTIPEIGNSICEIWQLLNDEQDNFETVLADKVDEDEAELDEGGDWEDDEFKSSPERQDDDMEELVDAQEDGWGDDDEPLEDLLDDEEDEEGELVEAKSQFSAPSVGQSITSRWTQVSDLALHHVLAGSYQTACGFLQTQVGVINFEPLKGIFKDLLLQSRAAYLGVSLYPTMFIYPSSSEFIGGDDVPLPAGGYKIEDLEERLTNCYSLFSKGKFDDAIEKFRNLLLSALFLQIYSSESNRTIEEREIRAKEIISISREYILAVQIWLEKKNIVGKEFEDHKRACELAAYFARLNLPKHRSKVLENAFGVFLKTPKEFLKTRAATSIARRLLDYVSASDEKKAKLVAFAEKVKTSYDAQVDQKIQLDYDDLNPYSLCAASFKPIFSGNQLVSCPLCDAKFKPENMGQSCTVCLVSQIGKSCSGIRFRLAEFGED